MSASDEMYGYEDRYRGRANWKGISLDELEQRAEKAGNDDARRLANVFAVRDDASITEKAELAMMFAPWNGATVNSGGSALRNGAAYVRGFIAGLDGMTSNGAMSKDEQVTRLIQLLEKQDRRLAAGPSPARDKADARASDQ